MYYKPLMYSQIPYCPYMMPDMMMRSEDSDDELDMTLPEDVDEYNLNDDLREDAEDDNIEDTNLDIQDGSRDDKIETQVKKDINDSSIKIDYDDNQFRAPASPDQILRMIEKNNPMIIRRLVMYGIPYHVALNMVRRIVYLTLQYYR